MNWMNLCWILDEKWRESLPHPLHLLSLLPLCLLSLFPPFACASLFAVILLLSHLFIRDSLPCLSLSTYSPWSYRARARVFFFFRLSSSGIALSGAALQKTNRPTDRFHPAALWKIFRWPDRFPIITLRQRKLQLQNAEAEVTSAWVLTYTSSHVRTNVVSVFVWQIRIHMRAPGLHP